MEKGSREEGQMWTQFLQTDFPTMFMCGGFVACGLDCFVNAGSELFCFPFTVFQENFMYFSAFIAVNPEELFLC